jgi:hypothetical protein
MERRVIYEQGTPQQRERRRQMEEGGGYSNLTP